MKIFQQFSDFQGSELRFHCKGLALAGFILPNGKKPSKFQILRYVSYHFLNISIHILACAHFFLNPYQLRRTLITIILWSSGFQTTFRPAHMIFKKKEVEQMIADFEEPPDTDSVEFIQKESEMRQKSKRGIVKLSAILYFYNGLLCLITLFPAVTRTIKVAYCDDKRELNLEFCAQESYPLYLYDFYWFTDPFVVPTFYYLYFYNCLMVVLYLLIFCASDAFTCSTLVALAARGEFLIQTAPTALSPDERGQITPIFKAWIKYHQRYESLLKTVNSVMGPVILVTHALAVISIMGYFYLVIKDDQEGLLVTVVSFLIVTAIQFFFYAYWGQQIINRSEELSRAVFSANQIAVGAYAEGPARSALSIIMAKCCGAKAQEITGLGYFTIGMRFYARIISVSVTYLLVLLQISIREGKQQHKNQG